MIVGVTRAMLHDQGLPLHLWVEACNIAVYLQNRSPHPILGMKTLEEAFSGKRPDVSHFRIFGSSIFFHVTKDAWKKLEPTTELGIFVGYTDTPHNYWVFSLESAHMKLMIEGLKSFRLLYVHLFLNLAIKECSLHIHLMDLPIHLC